MLRNQIVKNHLIVIIYLWGVVAERLESSTANPSMRVRAPIGADFSAHCEIKQSLNHFACSQVTGT